MNRAEKEAAVELLATEISEAEAIFAIDYRGISVPQAAELRAKLREAETTFRVSKNRLAKLAAEKVGQEGLDEVLSGPTALAFVRGDVAQAAKTITTFARENEILTYKGGLLGDLMVDEARFKSIASLPSRDVLNGQLAGVVASPLTGLARGLGGMLSGLAIALGQIAEKGLVGQNAPAKEEAPAEEATAEEPKAEEAPAEEPKAEEASAEEAKAEEAPAEEAPVEEPKAEEAPAEEETSQNSENDEE